LLTFLSHPVHFCLLLDTIFAVLSYIQELTTTMKLSEAVTDAFLIDF